MNRKPGILKQLQDYQQNIVSAPEKYKTLIDNTRYHSPGYLQKIIELENYEPITHIIQGLPIQTKQNIDSQTGFFNGNPGVLKNFNPYTKFK